MSADKLPPTIASDPSEAVQLAPVGASQTDDDTGRKRKEISKEDDLFHAFAGSNVVIDSAAPVEQVEPPTKKHATVYRCDVVDCGKVFGKKFNLKAHKRVHTGEEPFKCSFPSCTKTFKWQSSLSYHEGLHLSNSIDQQKGSGLPIVRATSNNVTQPGGAVVGQPDPVEVSQAEQVVVAQPESVVEAQPGPVMDVPREQVVVTPPEQVAVPPAESVVVSHPESVVVSQTENVVGQQQESNVIPQQEDVQGNAVTDPPEPTTAKTETIVNQEVNHVSQPENAVTQHENTEH